MNRFTLLAIAAALMVTGRALVDVHRKIGVPEPDEEYGWGLPAVVAGFTFSFITLGFLAGLHWRDKP